MDGDAMDMDLNGEAYGRCLSSFVDEGSKESHRYYLARRTLLEMLRDRGYAVSSSDIELSLQDFRSIHGQNPDTDRLRISACLRSDPANKEGAGRSVVELIEFAKKRVPKSEWRNTKVQLMGSSELEGVELVAREAIFESCRRVLRSSGFLFKNEWVAIMEDKTEEKEKDEEKSKHFLLKLKQVLVIFCEPTAVKVNTIRSIASQIMNRESLTRLILVVQNQMTNQAQKAVDLFSFKVEIFQITDLLVNITKHVLKPTHRVLNDKEKQNLLKKFSLEEKQIPRMLQKDAIARYYGWEKGQVVKVSYSDEITESHVTYRCVW
ncbi:unnamed protein product [Camellia sinensis]